MLGTLSPTWFRTTPVASFCAVVIWTANPHRTPATKSTRPRMMRSFSITQLPNYLLPCCQRRARRLCRWRTHGVVRLHDHLVVAVRIEELGVRLEEQDDLVRPRFQVRLGIVDGHGLFQVTEIDTPPAFGHLQRVAVRVGHVRAEPAAIAESNALDHEHLALPVADRISQPGRLRLAQLWQGPAVGEDLPERVAD